MASRDTLTDMLKGEAKPAIKRGRGVQLSTEVTPPAASAQQSQAAQPPSDSNAISHNRTIAQSHKNGPVRVNRGYKLREDLIRGCKRLAVDTGRPLYEIMEEALGEYLERHKT